MKKKDEIIEETKEEIDQGRRKALSRMGLVATAAYATPVLMTLSSSVKAQGTEGSEKSEISEPSMSEASLSEPSMSEPSMSEASMSEPSMSEASMSEASQSEPTEVGEDV